MTPLQSSTLLYDDESDKNLSIPDCESICQEPISPIIAEHGVSIMEQNVYNMKGGLHRSKLSISQLRKTSSRTKQNVITYYNDEIPIWVKSEPRFVSGITNETTCHDIIYVLINDDHLNNEVSENYKTPSDISNYIIIEKWRTIEQELSANELILPIWKSWGNFKEEVKFELKQIVTRNTDFVEQPSLTYNLTNRKSMRKLLKIKSLGKLIRRVGKQGHMVQECLLEIANSYPAIAFDVKNQIEDVKEIPSSHSSNNHMARPIRNYYDRELFSSLKIDKNGRISSGASTISNNSQSTIETVEYRQYILNKKLRTAIEINDLHQKNLFNEISEQNNETLKSNRKCDSPLKMIPRLEKILTKMSSLNQLMQRQEYLIDRISRKYKKYRSYNRIYKSTITDNIMGISIDDVQRQLDKIAQEIVRDEMRLTEIREMITDKYSKSEVDVNL